MGQTCNWSTNEENALKGLVIVVGDKLTLEKYYSYAYTQQILKGLENQTWLSNLFFSKSMIKNIYRNTKYPKE